LRNNLIELNISTHTKFNQQPTMLLNKNRKRISKYQIVGPSI